MELCKKLRFIFDNDSYAIAGSFFLIIASTSSTPVSATSAI
jgi:hypothetical protein